MIKLISEDNDKKIKGAWKNRSWASDSQCAIARVWGGEEESQHVA